MPTLTILEDSALPLQQMQQALSAQHDFNLIYTTVCGADMKQWLSKNSVGVLVADLGSPDMSGVEVIQYCKLSQPRTEIMVCTIFDDNAHVFDSLKAGANSYLLKADIESTFVDSLNQLVDGGAPMSPSIARRVLHQFQQGVSPSINTTVKDPNSAAHLLTKKEHEVLNLLMRGFKYAEIATTLGCGVQTVNSHIKSIYRKLQVTCATEAIYEARALSII